MKTQEAQLALDCRCDIGEGPFWHEEKIWWVDILGKHVHSLDPSVGAHRKHPMPCMVTAVVPREKGGFIAATELGIAVLEGSDLNLTHRTPSGCIDAEIRFNDGKCDPAGRFIAGTMHRKAKSQMGALYRVGEDFSLNVLAGNSTISNGLAWSANAATLYYIDSPLRRVDAFDYDIGNGCVANRRTVFRFPADQPGVPDGMTIDDEGCLLIAVWGGACVLRCDPQSGKLLEKILLPVSQPSSCCFGGEKRNRLYITSAREGMTEAQLEKEPMAGSLFQIDLPVPGRPTALCKN